MTVALGNQVSIFKVHFADEVAASDPTILTAGYVFAN